jgi:hypothetical protein
MRVVIWEDRRGYKHRSLVPDSMSDDDAKLGILQDPPDLHLADWEAAMKAMHNRFVEMGIYSWDEIQKANNLQNIIFSAVKPVIIGLFRSMKHNGG